MMLMVMCNSCVLWGDVETNLISYEMGWDGMGEYCGDDIAKPTRGGEFFGVDLSLSHSFTLSPVFNFSVDVTYFLFSFFFIFYFYFFYFACFGIKEILVLRHCNLLTKILEK